MIVEDAILRRKPNRVLGIVAPDVNEREEDMSRKEDYHCANLIHSQYRINASPSPLCCMVHPTNLTPTELWLRPWGSGVAENQAMLQYIPK